MLLPYLDVIRKNFKIVLGSSSEQRKKILQLSGLTENDFKVIPSNFEENLPKENFKTSVDYVRETSL